MRFDARVFTLAKDPEQPAECQDAYCLDLHQGVAAIADGVSSAIFSGPWATVLAEAVVADAPDPTDGKSFAAWLDRQRKTWASRINTDGLAWFQRAKLPAGAFSTLLWISIEPTDDPEAIAYGGARLRGHAIGDSCLLVVRGGELVHTFPVQSSAEFQADPIVLGSVDLRRDHMLQFTALDVFCYPDDLLILCTDAVADWALRAYESGQPPDWDNYWHMPEDDWRAEIAWLRHERHMRYDDATLVVLRVIDQRVEIAEPQVACEPEAAAWPEPAVEPEPTDGPSFRANEDGTVPLDASNDFADTDDRTSPEPQPVIEPEPVIEAEALAELDAIIKADALFELEPEAPSEPAPPPQPPPSKRRTPRGRKPWPFGRG